jgi:hypothetical protein
MLNGSCLSFCIDDALGHKDCVVVPVIDDPILSHVVLLPIWTMCNALDSMYGDAIYGDMMLLVVICLWILDI